jgi:nicotinamide-nucleotide amidase
MKASLLTVGTEITSGQIVNENARVLSQNLQYLGVETVIHISVPDDRQLILEALKSCAAKSELLFVTGGLGPTSDDFTRDLINIWAGSKPLEFHEPSWEKVQKRLTERGLVAHEFQKQQCYYPHGSTVLDNSQGTANGFYLQAHNKHLWALPGPPNEIEALWIDHVSKQIQSFPLDPKITKSWDVIGLGENQVAHIVESSLKGFQGDVGYRVHQPFVELKLSFYQSQIKHAQSYIDLAETLLAFATVARDGQDISLQFCKIIQQAPHMTIVDEVTDGRWLMQLAPHMKSILSKCEFTYSKKQVNPVAGWSAHLTSISDTECELKLQRDDKAENYLISTPLSSPALKERKKLYFAEMAMLKIVQSWPIT